jgi:CFEM domain
MILLTMALASVRCTLYTLIFLATASTALDVGLSPGVLRFVPACAEQCVASFVQVNYEGTDCGEGASLQCLCSTRGNTQFTLGEGVVQCITTERGFGQCSDRAASRKITGP